MNPDELKAEVLKFKANPSPCYLCEGRPYAMAIFIPSEPEKYGGSKDSTRFILYTLCKNCFKIPGVTLIVENRIRGKFRNLM